MKRVTKGELRAWYGFQFPITPTERKKDMSQALQAVKSELQPTETDLILQEWTPEQLQEAIERENKMRAIIVGYFRQAMKEGHHYYNLPGQENRKPALSKEGALNICSLFKVTPSPEEPKETFEPNGHYSCRSRVHFISNRTGAVVATGDGSCSTRESKYAYRWAWASEVPAHVDKDKLERKEWDGQGGRKNVKYKLPNEDPADLYNTVLKMAGKRAIVDAALKLPLVSELFTQDLEEQLAENVSAKAKETRARNTSSTTKVTPPPPAATEMKKRAINLKNKLIAEHKIDETETLNVLPEGVSSFDDLTEEQAGEVVPKLSGWLNTLTTSARKSDS
jgi:hypothetical protein